MALTNFTARIVADVVVDDGTAAYREFEVEAALGTKVARTSLTLAQFSAMNWPTALLGARALIYPGQKDRTRAAIQSLSGAVEERVVYTHLGWRAVQDRHAYLHAGGAIGTLGTHPDVDVRLPRELQDFRLPDPGSGESLALAVQRSLALLDIAPVRITVPLYASIARAVLGESDFALFLHGATGVGKTATVSLAQQHFGTGFDARDLPGSWSSTPNALMEMMFAAKDALLVIDDYLPPLRGRAARDQAERDVDRVLRAQGNRAGRQRLAGAGELREAHAPRGLVISTGEELPRGQSLGARLLAIEVRRGDVNWIRLTECQRDAAAGHHAQALAGFIRWLAPILDGVKADFRSRVDSLRQRTARNSGHRRTADVIAQLAVALDYWLEYAEEVGALAPATRSSLSLRARRALSTIAGDQRAHQAAQNPAQQFVALIRAALDAGDAHLAVADDTRPTDEEPARPGNRIGWSDADNVYLDPVAAYSAAQHLAAKLGEPALPPRSTLYRRLKEAGVLVSTESVRRRLTVRRSLGRRRVEVLHVRPAPFLGDRGKPTPPSQTTVDASREPDDEVVI